MIFHNEFVYCIFDAELVGKLCAFADDVPSLKKLVEQNDIDEATELVAPDSNPERLMYPFHKKDGSGYKFVYYDPNYTNKIAHECGKQIQYFDDYDKEWIDANKPTWDTNTVYRVKPDEPKAEPKAEPKYRPYEDIDEFISEYRAESANYDEPLVIWLRDKDNDKAMLMCDGLDRMDNKVRVGCVWWSMAELLEAYTYLDGAPLGVKE